MKKIIFLSLVLMAACNPIKEQCPDVVKPPYFLVINGKGEYGIEQGNTILGSKDGLFDKGWNFWYTQEYKEKYGYWFKDSCEAKRTLAWYLQDLKKFSYKRIEK